jgi:hypothetical protein
VSTTLFVETQSPRSTLIGRPNPSDVVFTQCPFVITVTQGGEFE